MMERACRLVDQHTAIDSPGSGWNRCTNRLMISSIARKTRTNRGVGRKWRQRLRRTITPRWLNLVQANQRSGYDLGCANETIAAAYEKFSDDYQFSRRVPERRKSSFSRRRRSIISLPRICWKTRASATTSITSCCPVGSPRRSTITAGWLTLCVSSKPIRR